jgi:hypothetical protein
VASLEDLAHVVEGIGLAAAGGGSDDLVVAVTGVVIGRAGLGGGLILTIRIFHITFHFLFIYVVESDI